MNKMIQNSKVKNIKQIHNLMKIMKKINNCMQMNKIKMLNNKMN